MILIPTGSFNTTEMLLKIDSKYPNSFIDYIDVWRMEKLTYKYKQPCLVGAFNTYVKTHKSWNFGKYAKIVEGLAIGKSGMYNDESYDIVFDEPPQSFTSILKFVRSGYSREDFSYIQTMVETYSIDIIERAIKEQDDNWNYVKLLFKKCVEVSSKVEEEKRRAKIVAGRVKTSNPLEEKDVDVFSAMSILDDWEEHNKEEDMWSIFD